MLHQRYKDLYFFGLSKATLPNYWFRKCAYALRPKNRKPLHLHLGCGPKYLEGFVNIDANPQHKLDLWLDVRCGLPYASNSVDSVYSTHMIEHFIPTNCSNFCASVRECLSPRAGSGWSYPI